MSTIAEKAAMVGFLNSYAFSHIWNQVSAEHRANAVLQRIGSRAAKGHIAVGPTAVMLPSQGLFCVFGTQVDYFGGAIDIDTGVWVAADQVLTENRMLIHIYDNRGRLMPRARTYIYRVPNSRVLLIALEAKAFWKVFGVQTTEHSFYMTTYVDSDVANTMSSWHFVVPDVNPNVTLGQINSRLTACLLANTPGTWLSINGFEVDPTRSYGTLVAGDHVEILLDRNVIGAFTINVSDNSTGYMSLVYASEREILHIPKSMNPDNALITHNTLTLFVRDNGSNQGAYLHRVDERCVENITHNDISVKKSVVDAFQGHLQANSVSVHIKVRRHGKTQALIPEANFLLELYDASDADIVRHLRGELDDGLYFWRADHLEASAYTYMMFDPPDYEQAEYLDTYVDALGIRALSAVLSHQLTYTQYDSNNQLMTIYKPFSYRNGRITPLVHVGGKKVRGSQVVCLDGAGASSSISLTSDVSRTNGDKIVVYQTAYGRPAPYRFAPVFGSGSINVPYRAVFVYEEVPLSEPIAGRTGSSAISYKKRIAQAGSLVIVHEENGTTTCVFGPSFYGKNVLIYNADFCVSIGANITDILQDNKPIIVPLLVDTDDNSGQRLLPEYGALEVYLNSRRLVNQVDYTAIPYVDGDDNPAWVEVIVANKEYLDVDSVDNFLEVVVHSSSVLASESGYVLEDKCSYDGVLNVWYEQNSRAYIKGECQTGMQNLGAWLAPPASHQNGELFLVSTTIPRVINDALAEYDRIPELNRIAAINRYFGRNPPVPPVNPTNPASHNLYSPYLSAIIYDVLNDVFFPVDEPDDDAFLAQFSGYDHLKLRDPAITRTSAVDLGFVDISGHYRTLMVTSGVWRRILQRLVNLVLPTDPYQHGDVLL